MAKTLSVLLVAIFLTGCYQNRSISHYRYRHVAYYNPSYNGEYSQISFIKDVADPKGTKPKAPVKVTNADKILLMQSGQLSPDSMLTKMLTAKYQVSPISGIPAKTAAPSMPLRFAASAGGMAKIIGYWGNIETTGDDLVSISLHVIVADVASGHWSQYTVHTDPEKEAYSFFNPDKADDEQVVRLKTQAYKRLMKSISADDKPN